MVYVIQGILLGGVAMIFFLAFLNWRNGKASKSSQRERP
jgi:hypothetical protein